MEITHKQILNGLLMMKQEIRLLKNTLEEMSYNELKKGFAHLDDWINHIYETFYNLEHKNIDTKKDTK